MATGAPLARCNRASARVDPDPTASQLADRVTGANPLIGIKSKSFSPSPLNREDMTEESLVEEARSKRNNPSHCESSDVSWESRDMQQPEAFKQQQFHQGQCYRSSPDGSLHGTSAAAAATGDHWAHYYYNHNSWSGNLSNANAFGSAYLHTHQFHHYQHQQMQPSSSISYPSYYGHHENGWSESLPISSTRSGTDESAQDCENFSPNRGLEAKSVADSSPDLCEYQHSAPTEAASAPSSAANKPSTAILYDWMQIKRVTRPPKDKSALYGGNNNVHGGKDGTIASEVSSSGAVSCRAPTAAAAAGFLPAAAGDPASYMLKRPRTSFSSEQILELEKEFHYNM